MAAIDTTSAFFRRKTVAQIPEELLLRRNNISTLKLREIDGTSLNDFIQLFPNVRKLVILECDLSGSQDEVSKLTQLEELDLSGNESFGVLCPAIGQLRRLKKLNLHHCGLKCLPGEIGQLETLEDLDLGNNKLMEFPNAVLKLTKLRRLDLQNILTYGNVNRITELPIALWNSPLNELLLYGNPLVSPPEGIWEQGMSAIRTYLYGMLIGSDTLCVDTINMLGDTGAGKTSIARSLKADCPTAADEDDRTRVMEHLEARIGLKTVNINDFGGHEIYHAVIPVFLPPGGLCILTCNLLESKEKQEITVKKWLVTILAKSSSIRVIVVGTRADQLSADECTRKENEMRSFVKEFFDRCNCEITSNMTDLESRNHSINLENKSDLGKKLQKVSEADYCVRTLSCTELNLSEKLRHLRDLVLNKLNPPERLPDSWCRFINDF